MRKLLLLLSATALATLGMMTGASAEDDLRAIALETFKALPSTVPSVKDNVITPEKISLGKALFFDPRLSASGVFSCNSCHNLATGGDDNLET
jgi:cytochrome c peroxidase